MKVGNAGPIFPHGSHGPKLSGSRPFRQRRSLCSPVHHRNPQPQVPHPSHLLLHLLDPGTSEWQVLLPWAVTGLPRALEVFYTCKRSARRAWVRAGKTSRKGVLSGCEARERGQGLRKGLGGLLSWLHPFLKAWTAELGNSTKDHNPHGSDVESSLQPSQQACGRAGHSHLAAKDPKAAPGLLPPAVARQANPTLGWAPPPATPGGSCPPLGL